MVERERKFLLKYLPEGLSGRKLEQAYLFVEGNRHARVRIADDCTAWLTIKTVKNHIERDEFEYEIPVKDARDLMLGIDARVEKTRYSTEFHGNHVDIDVYPDGSGVVEIEFGDEEPLIPDYCGDEITGEPLWSNLNMALANARKKSGLNQ